MSRRGSVSILVVVVAVVATGATACGGPARPQGPAEQDAGITVAAAASLTDAFTDIGSRFEVLYPGASVTFAFGPSDGLALQIAEGAPVDVFASASARWMDTVERSSGVFARADFARNRLAVIAPVDARIPIESLEDLGGEGVQLVLAAEGVPAGDYARRILREAGIEQRALANLVSNEADAKDVVTKVLSGDADAGIVYETDVTPELAGRVRMVSIAADVNVLATYPIAAITGTKEAALAERFVDFVLGPGQRTLARYGFLPAA